MPEPKGDCFEAALLAFMGLADITGAVLVHGWPVLTRPPYKRFAHAWVEVGDMVIDNANGKNVGPIPKASYYAVGNIVEDEHLHKYDRMTAYKLALKTGVYGPWTGGPDDAVENGT